MYAVPMFVCQFVARVLCAVKLFNFGAGVTIGATQCVRVFVFSLFGVYFVLFKGGKWYYFFLYSGRLDENCMTRRRKEGAEDSFFER